MNTTAKINLVKVAFVGAIALFLWGCTSTPVPSNCIAPSGKLVAPAFSRAQSSLAYSECWSQFGSYFDALLTAAEGDPKQENVERFSDFVGWSIERGVVTKVAGSELFTRYFSPNFVSLPNDRSVCSAVRSNPKLNREVELELRDKYRGLVGVAGNNATYAQAAREQASLVQILGAMESACQ